VTPHLQTDQVTLQTTPSSLHLPVRHVLQTWEASLDLLWTVSNFSEDPLWVADPRAREQTQQQQLQCQNQQQLPAFTSRLPLRHAGIALGASLRARGSRPQYITAGGESSTSDQPGRETSHPAQLPLPLLCRRPAAPLPLLGPWHTQGRGQAGSLPSSYMCHRQRCFGFLQATERDCFQTSLLLLLFLKPRQPTAISKAGPTRSLQQRSGKQLLRASSPPVTSLRLATSQDFISHRTRWDVTPAHPISPVKGLAVGAKGPSESQRSRALSSAPTTLWGSRRSYGETDLVKLTSCDRLFSLLTRPRSRVS